MNAMYVPRSMIMRSYGLFRKPIAFMIILTMIMVSMLSALSFASSSSAQDAPNADYTNCPSEDDGNNDNDARQLCGITNQKTSDGKTIDTTSNESIADKLSALVSGDASDDANTNLVDAINMVFTRVVSIGYYLNSNISSDGSKLSDYNGDVYAWKSGRQCDSLDKASSYSNDNCDVPNITTEAIQDLVSMIIPTGITGGETVSGKTPYSIGIPTELISGGTVPINRGTNKYTALEVFGYNLNWTTYNGEWDKIDVNTSERLKSSVSIGGQVTNVYNSVTNGITKAINNSNEDVSSAWSSGNVLKIAGSILSYPFKVIGYSGTNSVYNYTELLLNGYEENIFNSSAWSRSDFYDDTAYNVRVMSDTEKAYVYSALVQKLIEDSIASIAKQNDIDVSDIQSQSAFPTSKVQSVKDKQKEEDAKAKKENEKRAAAKKKENDEKRAADKKNNISGKTYDDDDYKKVTAQKVTEADVWNDWVKNNKTKLDWGKKNLSVDYSKYTPSGSGTASDEYATLKSDWNTAATTWNKTQIQDRLAKNLNSFQKIWAGVEDGAGQKSARKAARDAIADNKIFMVCVNDDGTRQGTSDNDTIKLAIAGGLKDPGKSAFNDKGEFQCSNSSGASASIRQPIVGALLGSQGTAKQKSDNTDTRRSAFTGTIFNPLSSLSSMLLSISQKVAMVINYLLGLSFQPILDSIGIKSVVVDVVKTLRGSMYMPMMALFVIIGAFIALIKALRGSAVEGLKSVMLIILSVILGILLLHNPNASFKLIDDYPSYAERAVAAIILQAQSSSSTDELCTSTGTVSGINTSSYKDLNGKTSSGFNPNGTIRKLECQVWVAYVFQPWVMGQFGSSYSTLYADGYASSGGSSITAKKSTTKLVGNAAVNLGGGKTIHNWALYQLSQQISGTSTTDDTSKTVGSTNKNLYRLVDLQAGVKNAKGKDTSHWNAWKGGSSRFLMGLMALMASIAGLMSIGMFAVAKISATLVMAMLFAIAPIMLLIGIIPGSGRTKMKSWMAKLLGLAVKRVLLVVMLSLQLMVLISASNSQSNDALSSMMLMMLISMVFATYGKQIIAGFTAPIDSMAGNAFQGATERFKSAIETSPLGNSVEAVKGTFSQSAGAIVGTALAGGLSPSAVFRNHQNRARDVKRTKYHDDMSNIRSSRDSLMRRYDEGKITGGQYVHDMSKLNRDEDTIKRTYKSDLDDIDHMSMRDGLDAVIDPKNYDNGLGTRLMSIKDSNMARLRFRSPVHFTGILRESAKSVNDEKKQQVKSAYNAILMTNPDLASAVLRINDLPAGDNGAKAMRHAMEGADLREISEVLHIQEQMSASEVVDSLSSNPNITFRRGANGSYVPIIDKELMDHVRKQAMKHASKNEVKLMKKQDDIAKLRESIPDIMVSYLLEDDKKKKVINDAKTRAHDNDSELLKDYDPLAPNDTSSDGHLDASDAVINMELRKELNDIDNDDSLTALEKKRRKNSARNDAYEKHAHTHGNIDSMTFDHAARMATRTAREEISRQAAIMRASATVNYDEVTGQVSVIPASGSPITSDDIDRFKSMVSDYFTMQKYVNSSTGNRSSSNNDDPIIRHIDRKVNNDIKNGDYSTDHNTTRTRGRGENITPLYPTDGMRPNDPDTHAMKRNIDLKKRADKKADDHRNRVEHNKYSGTDLGVSMENDEKGKRK